MPLLRNPQSVQPLEDLQVFVAPDDGSGTIPKVGLGGVIGPAWHTVGILNDGSAVGGTRTIEETNTAGIGYGVVARHYKPGDLTGTAETLEDNVVTRWIAWPDTVRHEATGVQIKLHSGRVARAWVLVTYVRQDGTVQADVTRYPATLRMENVGRGETVEGKEIAIGYIPGPDKDVIETHYFAIQEGDLVALDPRIFAPDAEVDTTGGSYQVGGTKPAGVSGIQETYAEPADVAGGGAENP